MISFNLGCFAFLTVFVAFSLSVSHHSTISKKERSQDLSCRCKAYGRYKQPKLKDVTCDNQETKCKEKCTAMYEKFKKLQNTSPEKVAKFSKKLCCKRNSTTIETMMEYRAAASGCKNSNGTIGMPLTVDCSSVNKEECPTYKSKNVIKGKKNKKGDTGGKKIKKQGKEKDKKKVADTRVTNTAEKKKNKKGGKRNRKQGQEKTKKKKTGKAGDNANVSKPNVE